jgi:DNA-binding transcriptional LysR family regulator
MAAFKSAKPLFSLKQSTLFVYAAASRNQFTVARALFVSPASVSRALATLENELQTPLFERHHCISKLTESGKVFLEHAQSIFECQARMFQSAVGLPSNVSTLTPKLLHMRLQSVESFVAVSEDGAFSATARANGLPQSGFSRDVKLLEDTLNSPLFTRTSSRVELTAIGHAILPIARRLLEIYADACSAMNLWRTKQAGKLMIAGSLAVLPKVMPSFLESLRDEFDGLRIELKSELSDRVEHAVLDGTAAIGLTGSFAEKQDFIYTHVLQAPLGLISSDTLSLPATIESLENLLHIPMLRFDDQAVITQTLRSAQCSFETYFNSRIIVNSVDAGLELVRSGKFGMLITGVGADVQNANGLKFLPLQTLLPSVTVSVITKRDVPFSIRLERIKFALVESLLNLPWHSSIKKMR